MDAVRIAMHELKAALSATVARAAAGEVIEVTSHGKTVARIVGAPMPNSPGLARLLSAGAAQWNGGKPAFRPPLTLKGAGRPMSELVIEDRG